ncbi:MAG: hypothetical protein RR162_01055 [Oscillospiraceae bacterium]
MFNIFKGRVKTEKEIEIDGLKKELKECEFLLFRNDIIFNMATDDMLIEAKIYEREALLRQYNYLIIRLKGKQKETVAIE